MVSSKNVETFIKDWCGKLSKDMPTYNSFVQMKKDGKILSDEMLDKKTLLLLWHFEGVSDNSIAELFDISNRRVAYLRQKYGVTLGKCTEATWDIIKELRNQDDVEEPWASIKSFIELYS